MTFINPPDYVPLWFVIKISFFTNKLGMPYLNIRLYKDYVICSWLLTHTMFALHYARTYYNEVDGSDLNKYAGGLEFPTDEPPDFLDFMYFAFTIGFTSQTSDVSITIRSIRRLVLFHEMVSFFLYSVIIATTVNTVASLL